MASPLGGFHLRDHALFLAVLALLIFGHPCTGSRTLLELYQPDPRDLVTFHNGAVLSGDIPVSILWYGSFTPAQKAIVTDFLTSLAADPKAYAAPSVPQWSSSLHDLYLSKQGAKAARLVLSGQVSDEGCSLGKSLNLTQLPALAASARPGKGGVALLLTAPDVAVESFCMSRCGTHGTDAASGGAYVWAGDSSAQCPGQCAWPFNQPDSHLKPPNGDVGIDGLVINLASLLAGAMTNPSGDGFYQGDPGAPLEAATACSGVYGSGAYPGYAGQLLVDSATGGSYNANGENGRKYVMPALFDPASSSCATLV